MMLPIERAEIYYPDGSVYRIPEDGTWANAPPFGVQCIVYYHVDDLTTLTSGVDHYVYEGETYKMGLWQDDEGFYRVMDLASGKVTP